MTVPVAFDPKWSMVGVMTYLEGIEGATNVAAEKGPAVTLSNCAVSTSVSRWGRGSVFFPSDAAAGRYVTIPSINFLSSNPQIIQNSFYPTDTTGERYVFAFGDRVTLAVVDGILRLRIKTTASATPEYTITLPGVVPGEWYDWAIRLDSTGGSLEVNGAVAGSVTWGGETHGPFQTGLLLGNNSSAAASAFRGYVGPLRWTFGDTRNEDIGEPPYRFPVLGAVDPHREKVVFHFHCEPTSGAIVDTKGNAVQMVGDSKVDIGLTYATFGIGAVRADPCIRVGPNPDFVFGGNDWIIEAWNKFAYSNSDFQWAWSIVSPAGAVVLALRHRNDINRSYLVVNDVEHEIPVRVTGYMSVSRSGSNIAVHGAAGSARRLLIDVGDAEINGDGYFYIGKAPVIAGAQNTFYWLDEIRGTLGVPRNDPIATTITPPTEKFSDYGPRSLSGHVLDHDGTPVQCTVRCYHAASGRLVSESVSDVDGSFVLPTADLTEHFWTAHHPTKNALIFDHIQPALVE